MVHNDRRALRILDAFKKLTKNNFVNMLLREEFIAGMPCVNCDRCLAAEASASANFLPVTVASSSNEFESDLEEGECCFGLDDGYELSAQLDDVAAFDISRIPDRDSVAELNMALVEPVVEDLGKNCSLGARSACSYAGTSPAQPRLRDCSAWPPRQNRAAHPLSPAMSSFG